MATYIKSNGLHLISDEELSSPNLGGLSRLREDSIHSNLSERRPSPSVSNSNIRFFPTESLHSFSFSSQTDIKSELRRGLLYRSLDFVKNKYGNKYVESIINSTVQNKSRHWLSAVTGHLMNGKANGVSPVGEADDSASNLPPIRSVSSPNLSALGRQIDAISDCLQSQQQPSRFMVGTAPTPSRSHYISPRQTPSILSPIALLSPLSNFDSKTSTLPSPITPATPLSINTVHGSDNASIRTSSLPTAPVSNRAKSLHSPTRFLAPNKAMMTTDAQLKVLTANDQALFIFGAPEKDLIGASIMTLVAPSYRDKCSRFLNKAPGKKDVVLVCGKVIRASKKDGTHIPTSLWLKRKIDEQGAVIFIWVFEAIKETTVALIVAQMTCELVEVRGPFQELFGWEPKEIYDLSITDIVAALDDGSRHVKDFDVINQHKFFGATSKRGVSIPVILKYFGNAEDNPSSLARQPGHVHIQVTSMPNIAGVITVDSRGIIQSCNSVFAKYLFGLGANHFQQDHVPVSDIIPQFWQLVETVEDGRSEKFLTARESRRAVATNVCPKIGLDSDDVYAKFVLESPVLNVLRGVGASPPNGIGIVSNISNGTTGIVATHRDGSCINVDVQVRAIISHHETVYALWVTYDRAMGTVKSKRQPLNPSAPTSMIPLPSLLSSELSSRSSRSESPKQPSRTSDNNNKMDKDGGRDTDESSGRIVGLDDVTTSVAESKEFLDKKNPINADNKLITSPIPIPPKEPANAKTITVDDYDILDSLGDGAYGYVRLALKKDDPTKAKVVLKYIVKSRILVDCWTRDKVLGLVPLEVHILHHLRTIPHPNIVSMIDYFEDQDFFYIVMALHGFGMDLFDYIELNQSLAEDEIRSIFYQIVLGVQHLHRHGIVHRDIKDENVILDDELRVQLVDFGSSAYVRPGKKFETFCGTMDYAAPEVLTGHKYTGPPQDCWALGILLYTMTYKENPFYNIDEIISRELRVPFVMSEDSIDLIRFILNRDVNARPKIEQIEQHQWFSSIRSRFNC